MGASKYGKVQPGKSAEIKFTPGQKGTSTRAARRELTAVRSIPGRFVWWPAGQEEPVRSVRELGFLGVAGLF